MTAQSVDNSSSTALDAERAFLLRSLADLEAEHRAGDLDDSDYVRLKDEYTGRAARVLRQLDGSGSRAASPSAAASRPHAILPSGPRGATAKRRGLAWVAAALAAVGIGVAVARSAGERVGGDGLTGSVRAAAASPERTRVATLLTEGRAHLADDPLRALKAFDKALKVDPGQIEALTYGGWILRLVATATTDPAQAKELLAAARGRLDRAVALDPTYPDARAFRGVLRLRDADDAKGALEDFDALDKLQAPPSVQRLVAAAKRDAEAQLAAAPTAPSASTP